MLEIGATLREARMRARIDIAEIETATKIRAKYLRALENEEWELLPGPTFVKTFLRTYAEALGLDAKLLVDEYKIRHERLADLELRPISPRSRTTGGRAGRPSRRSGGSVRIAGGGGRSPRGPITLVLVLLVLGILAVLGLTQGDDEDRTAGSATTPATTATQERTTPAPSSTGTAPATPPRRRLATLRVLPTGDVEVCLRARGRAAPLFDGVVLRSGENSRQFRSSSFRIRLGNNRARLSWNGRSFTPSPSPGPLGYLLTPTRRVRLPADQLPSCS